MVQDERDSIIRVRTELAEAILNIPFEDLDGDAIDDFEMYQAPVHQ